jgi:ATP-dependent DNA ligase
MPQRRFEPCIPTRSTKVPSGPDWIHEIKHDGYRLLVQRDGKRVRLFTRNGHDWTDRYPLIVEAALKNRSSSFVIDGEAVLSVSTACPISRVYMLASMMRRFSFTRSIASRSTVTICVAAIELAQNQSRQVAGSAARWNLPRTLRAGRNRP